MFHWANGSASGIRTTSLLRIENCGSGQKLPERQIPGHGWGGVQGSGFYPGFFPIELSGTQLAPLPPSPPPPTHRQRHAAYRLLISGTLKVGATATEPLPPSATTAKATAEAKGGRAGAARSASVRRRPCGRRRLNHSPHARATAAAAVARGASCPWILCGIRVSRWSQLSLRLGNNQSPSVVLLCRRAGAIAMLAVVLRYGKNRWTHHPNVTTTLVALLDIGTCGFPAPRTTHARGTTAASATYTREGVGVAHRCCRKAYATLQEWRGWKRRAPATTRSTARPPRRGEACGA